jgi:hypothetical protein
MELLSPIPAFELSLSACRFGFREWTFSIEQFRPGMLLHPMFQVGYYANIQFAARRADIDPPG